MNIRANQNNVHIYTKKDCLTIASNSPRLWTTKKHMVRQSLLYNYHLHKGILLSNTYLYNINYLTSLKLFLLFFTNGNLGLTIFIAFWGQLEIHSPHLIHSRLLGFL